MNTSVFKKISILGLAIIVVALGVVGIGVSAGVWQDASSLGDSRAPFVNSGPVKQIKEGGLHIATSGGANTTGSFSVEQPAEILGGFYTTSAQLPANLVFPDPAAIIDGELCVGFSTGCTIPAASPTTFNIYGATEVTNDIRVENLAHSGSSQTVCADASGWLVPCDGSEQVEDTEGPLLTDAYGCFVAGTMVEMADGSFKKIEEVHKGEVVRGSSQDNAVKAKYEINYEGPLYSMNGSGYFVSSSHPFMTTDGWKSFDPKMTAVESPGLEVAQLGVGDVLIRADGSTQKLAKFDFIMAKQTVYNFGLEGSRDFYADGYLVHNVNLLPIAYAAESGADDTVDTTEVLTTKLGGTTSTVIDSTGGSTGNDVVGCGLPDSLEGQQFNCNSVGLIVGMPADTNQWGGDPWSSPDAVLGCFYPESTPVDGECGCGGVTGSSPTAFSGPTNQYADEFGYCIETQA